MEINCAKFLDKTSSKFPDKIAFIDASSFITFQELRNNSLLLKQKISDDVSNQPILIFLPKEIKAIVAIFGVLYSGNFYVPIDVKLPALKTKLIVEDLNPSYIVTNSILSNKLTKEINFPKDKIIILDDNLQKKPIANVKNSKQKKSDANRPAYCIYTSGSTGTPKGVLISHLSLANFIDWATKCFNINNKSILGNQSPLFFDVSVMDLFLTIKNGSTTFLIPEILFAFPHKLIDFICKNKINHLIWVPSVLSNVAKNKALSNKSTSLKNVLFAGEQFNVGDLNYWRQNLKNTNFHNLYGPTEATVIATYHKIDNDLEYDIIPIGKPIDNVECVGLDEDGKEIDIGEIGELYISGKSLAICYWNNSQKTSEAFLRICNLRKSNKKWYKTGDLVKFDSNKNFIFLGRKDTQIKYMGYRIELGEIEKAVSKLDFIDENCVIFDKQQNEIILISVSNDELIDKEKIKVHLINSLPKYMVPKKIIQTKQMPLNSNGKIDRKLLMRRYASK